MASNADVAVAAEEGGVLPAPVLGGGGGGEGKWGRRGEVLVEARRQMLLAGPLVFVNFLLFALQIISVMFVGHLGELALASSSMATAFSNVTSFSLLLGMSCALDTFCGQAFGAKQYHMLGVYMQRAMLILTLLSIPLSFISAYAGKILVAFKQDREISLEAGLYARWLIPSIFGYALLQCHVKFLQTQNVVIPMMISTGATTLLHLPICWLLVFKSELGNNGAALANGISYWLNLVILAIYIRLSPTCKKTWSGFSKEAVHDMLSYVKLAVPAAIMVCLEFWSFEMLVLLSGLLPNPKLETSVLSICLNTVAAVFMIVSGLGSAVSVRVSNELGAGHPKIARLAVRVAISLAIVVSIMIGLTMIIARNVWGRLYSNDRDVIKYMARMMPLLAVSTLFDGIQCVCSGTARGCGWQKMGACVNLGAYYIVGAPSGIIMAFVFHIGGKGLWLGITCALIVQAVLLLAITLFTNWEKEATKARARVSTSTISVNMTSETISH